MKRLALVLVLVTGMSLQGCSFVFVSGPPANHQQLPYFDCTESRVVPVLDTIWTVLQTLNFVAAVSQTDQEWNDLFNGDPAMSRSTAIPVYAVLAAAGGAGMYYGFTKVSSCKSAKAQWGMRVGNGGAGGGAGTWPPPGGATGYPPAQPGYPPAQPAPSEPAPSEPAPADPQP